MRGDSVTSVKDPLSPLCGHMTTMVAENKALHSQCIKLEAKIHIVKEKQVEMLQLLKGYDSSSENGEGEIEDSVNPPLTQLDQIMTPKLNVADNDDQRIAEFAAYLTAVSSQNRDLRGQIAQLKEKLASANATHSRLEYMVTSWKAKYKEVMNERKQLTKKVRESIKM